MSMRYIDTSFWTDSFVLDLAPEERYFYLYLITNPHGNISGIYELSMKLMEFETGLKAETLRGYIDHLEKLEKIRYAENYVMLRNFLKHQRLNNSMKQSLLNTLAELPQTVYTLYTDWVQTVPTLSTDSDILNLNLNKLNLNTNLNLNKDAHASKCVFKTPTLEEVREYIAAKGYSIDAESFYTFYESNGWMVGKNHMNNWKATVQQWNKRQPVEKTAPVNEGCML